MIARVRVAVIGALLALCAAVPVRAQVAFETSLAPTSVTFAIGGETETVLFDAGSTANRYLIVCVDWMERTNNITGVTYAGDTLSSLGAEVTESGTFSAQCFGRHGPASGSNNIAVTMSAGDNNSDAQISAWVANTVDSVTPTDGYQSNNGNASTANVVSTFTGAFTSATNDRVFVFAASKNGSANLTASATNYQERRDAFNSGGLTGEFGDADGAASVSPSTTWSNGAGVSTQWIVIGINLNVAAAAGPCLRMLLGVGCDNAPLPVVTSHPSVLEIR